MYAIDVRFRMPTEWIGVEYSEEVAFRFDDDMSKEDMDEEIRLELRYWVEDILNDLRAYAEYEVIAEGKC